jgi:tRNA pseudouridine38-40 synthase
MDKRRLLVILEYDGTDFEGFQIQKTGRTVQGELEKALLRITGSAVRVIGAGRTDTGVHALGQAAHFDTAWDRSFSVLQHALNAVLPRDIAVRSIREVALDFSARYDAVSRAYRYTILNRPIRSPLACRYSLLVSETLDVDSMNKAAQELQGSHDFGAFGKPPHGVLTVRELLQARVGRTEDYILIDLEANAFLYRMVRRIVGTLLEVGKGALTLEEFREVLARKRAAAPPVPPQGLCLLAVKYE